MKALDLYIGEGFEGPGVNAAHINILIGPRNGPAGQAFANSLASPSQGHCPFMVIAQPNIPVKPMTLYVNKAEISSDLHGNATWGASQAGIAKAVLEALLDGTLPPEAEDEWAIVTAGLLSHGQKQFLEIGMLLMVRQVTSDRLALVADPASRGVGSPGP